MAVFAEPFEPALAVLPHACVAQREQVDAARAPRVVLLLRKDSTKDTQERHSYKAGWPERGRVDAEALQWETEQCGGRQRTRNFRQDSSESGTPSAFSAAHSSWWVAVGSFSDPPFRHRCSSFSKENLVTSPLSRSAARSARSLSTSSTASGAPSGLPGGGASERSTGASASPRNSGEITGSSALRSTVPSPAVSYLPRRTARVSHRFSQARNSSRAQNYGDYRGAGEVHLWQGDRAPAHQRTSRRLRQVPHQMD